MKLSILTATYNRADYLPRLYKSIKNNVLKTTDLKIEWIIVDDGSTDNTKQIVQTFIDENLINVNREIDNMGQTVQGFEDEKIIKIKYVYEKNSGKMVAINRGMEEVTGELTIDCDSDDYFLDNAFSIIKNNATKLFENEQLYGLCFLKQDISGNISGNIFKSNYMESTMFDLYFKQDIIGEKVLVFNTKIRKSFKHEVEENEKFVTEARMYHKMDKDYKILCINEVIQVGEYLTDGYTRNISKVFTNNPKGYYKYFKEILQKGLNGMNFKKKIYVIKNFILFKLIIVFYNKSER